MILPVRRAQQLAGRSQGSPKSRKAASRRASPQPVSRKMKLTTSQQVPLEDIHQLETFALSLRHTMLAADRALSPQDIAAVLCHTDSTLEWIRAHPGARVQQIERHRALLDTALRPIQVRYAQPGDTFACSCGWRLPPWQPDFTRAESYARERMVSKHRLVCAAARPRGAVAPVSLRRACRQPLLRLSAEARRANSVAKYQATRAAWPSAVRTSAHELDLESPQYEKAHSRYLYPCSRCGRWYPLAMTKRITCPKVPVARRLSIPDFERAVTGKLSKFRGAKTANPAYAAAAYRRRSMAHVGFQASAQRTAPQQC